MKHQNYEIDENGVVKEQIMPDDYDATLARVEKLSEFLDSKFSIPGTSVRFGYDAILGLIPVVGDTTSLALSGYIVYLARQCNARKSTLARMLMNIGKDYLIGLVPLVGDWFDIASKANLRNLALLKKELEGRPLAQHSTPNSSQ